MLIDRDRADERRRQFPPGTRVRAVRFVLDEGLRIWPDQDWPGRWRVVRVANQRVEATLTEGTSAECQERYPDAVFGIDDNESVPPGTEGTVTDVDDAGTVKVAWDNGRSIGFLSSDVVERV